MDEFIRRAEVNWWTRRSGPRRITPREAAADRAEHVQAKPLNRAMMVWFWDQYAPDERLRAEPHASPLGADLRGLPPVTIVVAEIDPLASEGQAYAEKLRAAGVTVNYRVYESVTTVTLESTCF